MKFSISRFTLALASAGLVTLYGCGGGGGGGSTGSSLTITGTAATGAAIANGAVSVTCASGTGTATTNADGSYTVTITGGTAPCLLKATATDALGVTTNLYSAIETGQTVANITPLTQMVVAAALGADPATAFTAGVSGSTATNLSSASLSSAVTKVQQVATNLGLSLSMDPLKATLIAATDNATGNPQDQIIDGLMIALKNSNITVAQLTTAVVSNASSASNTLTAIQALATDPNAPLTASGLSSCPVARSGGYLYASPGDTALNRVFINFGSSSMTPPAGWTGAGTLPTSLAALTGYDYTNGTSFTVATVTASSVTVPCAYTFTVGSKPVNVRVSAAGLAAFSINGSPTSTFPDSSAVAFDNGATSAAGLMLPIQKKWVNADLAGTMYAMNFGKVTSSGAALFGTNSTGVYKNFYTKFVIAAGGTTAKSWICDYPGSCPLESSQSTNDYTISAPNSVDGTFTFTAVTAGGTTVPGNPSQVAVYSLPNGDTVALAVVSTTNLVGLSNNFSFMSNRVSAIPRRSVGESFSNWSWQISNNSSATLSQSSAENTFTVSSATANTFSRSWTDAGVNKTDTISLDSPIVGMITRSNGTASSGNPPKPFYGFTGAGWSVYASSAPGGGADVLATLRTNNFLGFSIAKQ